MHDDPGPAQMPVTLHRRALLRAGVVIGAALPLAGARVLVADAAVSPVSSEVMSVRGFPPVGPDGTVSVAPPVVAPRTFTAVGARLPAGATVRVRTSVDGVRFGPWLEVRPLAAAGEGPDGDEADGGRGSWRAMSLPVWTGTSRWLQLAVGGASPDEVEVTLLAEHPSRYERVRAGRTALASTDEPVPAGDDGALGDETADPPPEPDVVPSSLGLRIVTRAQWGADETLRKDEPAYAERVRHGVVHHTANNGDYAPEDAAAIVRSIYRYHTVTLGWNDIGYNLLVDRFGVVYEGRFGGVDRAVVGAHTQGANTGSFGVAVIGDFTTEPLPPEAEEALLRVLLAKFDLHAIDPHGTVDANGRTVGTLAGHGELGSTECPGAGVHERLESLRTELGRRVRTAFTDITGHAHEESIRRLRAAGITSGYPDGTFRPDDPVSRGQMATFLARAAGLAPGAGELPFTDVDDAHPHRAGIAAVAAAGVSRGYGDGTFRPEELVSRAAMASFLARALALPEGVPDAFEDVPVDHVHAPAIGALARAGIASGDGAGRYRPAAPVSRGQMATLIVRAFER